MTRKKRAKSVPKPSSRQVQQIALEKYRFLLSADEFTALQLELEKPLSGGMRINSIKTSPRKAVSAWSECYGWKVHPVSYCSTGWWLDETDFSPSQTPEHRMGFFYLQDAASMLPVELFDFSTGNQPLVLDMAASPGGKTTHLLDKMNDRGLVIANDASASRIQALRVVLSNWGAASVAVTNFPGEKFGIWFPEIFDKVLLDAPCSMENLRSTETRPMRPISSKERSALTVRQAGLLASALQTVKPGGQVVYSTCTLAPEEDEGVLDVVLKQFPGAVRVDDVSSRLTAPAPGLAGYGEREFHPEVTRSARLFPHLFGTSGFFAARLTKTNPIPVRETPPPQRSLTNAGWFPATENDLQIVSGEMVNLYGLEIIPLMTQNHLTLWQNGRSIILAPELFFNHFPEFPVKMLGLLLAKKTAEHWEISHEASSRFWSCIQKGKIILDEEQVSAWQRGEDLPISRTEFPAGTVVLITDELNRFLGRGRLISRGLKNLLPHRVLL